MGFRLRTKAGVDILRFQGDLSSDEMIRVKNRLTRLLNKNHKKLLLDLEETKRVELAGLGMLVDRLIKIRERKGDLKLINLRPEVKQAFEMVGVSGLLQSFQNEEEAIQSFAA